MMPPVQQNAPQMQSPILSPVTPPQPIMTPDVGPTKIGDPMSLVKTIAIVILSLTTVAFAGLFIYFLMQSNDAEQRADEMIGEAIDAAATSDNYESLSAKYPQVSKGVSSVIAEQKIKSEKEWNERNKYPYKSFAGPADYGSLSFEYPKTWNVYIANDILKGGDFEAYFDSDEVDSVDSKNSLYSLRVKIRDKSFESVVAEYQKAMDRKDSNLTVESITLECGVSANKYTGVIPNTEYSGYIVIFKIRDKTAIVQTDSSVVFGNDFQKILDSITFNA